MSAQAPMTLIWPLALRLLHAALAVSVLIAFATHEGAGKAHEISGYIALACAILRIVLGFFGAPIWRFFGFVRSLKTTLAYAGQMLKGKEARHIGHNPLGAWMIVALLACAALAGFSGWLYTTDRFWGVAWVDQLHSLSGHTIMVLFLGHVLGVVFSSLRHRENLVASMLHGKKRLEEMSEKL